MKSLRMLRVEAAIRNTTNRPTLSNGAGSLAAAADYNFFDGGYNYRALLPVLMKYAK